MPSSHLSSNTLSPLFLFPPPSQLEGPIASLDGSESLTCLFMAVPKVGSGHYDTLFLFDRHGISLAADVRHLHEKVDSGVGALSRCNMFAQARFRQIG